MIFDMNAWLGNWPFRALADNTPNALLDRMDRHGIQWAAVSSLDAILHRNCQPANEALVATVAPFDKRLFPMATINPTYVKWEHDLQKCHEELGMRGVRLFPQYHGYDADGVLATKVVSACKERGLPVFIPQRMEDVRQRHRLDPGQMVSLEAFSSLVEKVPGAKLVLINARGKVQRLLGPALIDLPWYIDTSLAEVLYSNDLQHLVEKNGPKHLVFGTHSPISYAGPALVKRALLNLRDEHLDQISFANAARLLGLQLA